MPKYPGVEKRRSRFYARLHYKGKRYTPNHGFDTAEEAYRWRARKLTGLRRWDKPDDRTTIETLAIQYLELFKQTHSKTTLLLAESIVRVHIMPAFGNIRVVDLTLLQIEQFRTKLLEKYTSTWASMVIGYLRRILDRAVKLGITPSNLARLTDPIPKTRQEKQILTIDQVQALLRIAPPRERTIIAIAVLSGLRKGEIFGLQWGDIDLERRMITVKRQVYKDIIKEPKTRTSTATVPITKELLHFLKEWKKESHGSWLFSTPPGAGTDDDHPIHPNRWVTYHFKGLLEKCGLPNIQFHSLRHTFVTLLLNAGINLMDVKYFARHSTVTTTEQYAHKNLDRLEEIAASLSLLNRDMSNKMSNNRDLNKFIP